MKQLCICIAILLTACAPKQNFRLSKNLYDQSLLEFKQKNLKKSLQLVNEALEKYKTPQALSHKAILLYQIGKPNESAQIFKQVLNDSKLPPSLKPDILNNYACSLLSLNKKLEAKKIWQDLTTDANYLSPEVAWYNIGLLELMDAKNKIPNQSYLEKAEESFTNAINIAKEYIDAMFYLAITQIMLEKNQEGKQTLIELITIAPEHTSAKYILTKLDAETTLNFSS